jgi:integrase/recombinase XerD
MTIEEGIKAYLNWGIARYEPSTIKNYAHWLKRFEDFMQPWTMIEDINPEDFLAYLHHLRSKRIGNTTQSSHMIAVRMFWEWAHLNKYTEYTHRLIPVPKYKSKPHHSAEQSEVQQMLESIEEEGDGLQELRDMTIIAMLYATGVRVSELCDLNVSDLNLAQRYAAIVSKKNHLNRTIVWDDVTEVLLLKYLVMRNAAVDNDFLFISLSRKNFGIRLHQRSVQRLMRRLNKKLNFQRRITPHSLRHGFGSDMVSQRIHPRFIQRALGHKNLNSSEIYMQVNDVELRDVYKEFAEKRKLDI